jgi:predicted esterase
VNWRGIIIVAWCGIVLAALVVGVAFLYLGRRPGVEEGADDQSRVNIVQFCENSRCVGKVGVLARVVGERETAMAGLYLSSARGDLSDDESGDLKTILEESYDNLDGDERFSGKPNALLVRSDDDEVRYLQWVPGEGSWPCIVFLHGFGGMMTPYFRALVESELGQKAILLAPILDNTGAWWEEKGISLVKKLVEDNLPPGADRTRVYLMGLSNGAVGATVAGTVPELATRLRGFVLVSGIALLESDEPVHSDFLVLQGLDDVRFDSGYIDEGVERLRTLGANVEYETFVSNHFMLLKKSAEVTGAVVRWMESREAMEEQSMD